MVKYKTPNVGNHPPMGEVRHNLRKVSSIKIKRSSIWNWHIQDACLWTQFKITGDPSQEAWDGVLSCDPKLKHLVSSTGDLDYVPFTIICVQVFKFPSFSGHHLQEGTQNGCVSHNVLRTSSSRYRHAQVRFTALLFLVGTSWMVKSLVSSLILKMGWGALPWITVIRGRIEIRT